MLRKEHITYPGYQYWTTSLLDFNIYHLGLFTLVHLENLCCTFFFFILLGSHRALERETDWKVFDIFVLSPAVCISGEWEHMAVWEPACNSENPVPKIRSKTDAVIWLRARLFKHRCGKDADAPQPSGGRDPSWQAPHKLLSFTLHADSCHFSCVCFYI